MMVTSKQIQNLYTKLYPCLREYIWPMDNVVDIAELEIAVFDRFPDLDNIKNRFRKIEYMCKPLINDDEDLKLKLDKFNNFLDNSNTIYAKLDTRVEEN